MAKGERSTTFDIVRAAAAGMVTMCHYDVPYMRLKATNVAWCMCWVLYSLFFISGACFSLSKHGCMGYNVRLFVYMIVGAAINYVCFEYSPIRTYMGDERLPIKEYTNQWKYLIVFWQFWFIKGLLMTSIVTSPLRMSLRAAKLGVTQRSIHRVITMGYVAFLAIFWMAKPMVVRILDGINWLNWGSPQLHRHMVWALTNWTVATVLIWLTKHEFPSLLGRLQGIIPWVALIMAPMCYFYDTKNDDNMTTRGEDYLRYQVFLVGYLTQEFEPLGVQKVRDFIRCYWPFMVVALSYMWVDVDTTEAETKTLPKRLQYAGMYSTFMILLMTCGMPRCDILTKDYHGASRWLTNWALWTYVAHLGSNYYIGAPWCLVWDWSLMVPFYIYDRVRYGFPKVDEIPAPYEYAPVALNDDMKPILTERQ